MANKKAWGPHPSRRGVLTARAKRHGRSVHEEAEIDAKSPNKTIRGQGQFALNAQKGVFRHKVGKKKAAKKSGASRTSKKRTARKRGR